MDHIIEDPAVQGGVRCIPGKKHAPDYTTSIREIHDLSCPYRLRERIRTRAQLPALLRPRRFFAKLLIPGMTRNLDADSMRWRAIQYFRLHPWGCAVEPDGSYVIFDRRYNRLARLRPVRPPETMGPREPSPARGLRFFYEDATAPYLDPRTPPLIVHVADLCGLREEIDYRWALSDYGRIRYRDWTQHWKRR